MKSRIRPLHIRFPGSETNTPYVIEGNTYQHGSSPAILITAGMHGDEPTAIATLWYLRERLRHKKVAAAVTVLPCVNVIATQLSSHLVPLEKLDPNRCFPGRKDGSFADRLAFKLAEILLGHDAYIDVHTAGWCTPFVLLDKISDPILECSVYNWVRIVKIPIVSEMIDSHARLQNLERCSTAWAIQRLKKPAFTLELTGFKTLDSKCAQKAADWLLQYINAFSPSLASPGEHKMPTPPSRHEIYSEYAGLFEAFLKPGNRVTKGECLGRVCSHDGRPKWRVLAPAPGIVLALQPVSAVQLGSWLVTLAITPHPRAKEK